MKKIFITIAISITTCCFTMAQSISPTVIATSGGFHEAGGHSLSFTVGEAVTETFSAGSNILTQGFQQPEMLTVGIRDISKTENFSVIAYPNPSSGIVHIQINASNDSEIILHLYDLLGKRIQYPFYGQLFDGTHTFEIDLTPFASGLYFARLTNKEGQLKEVLSIQKTR